MITPSFGITATERVLPRLALDFTTANLDSRVTFARSLNTATRVNSSGLIEVVNADLPRFDFDPITKICKGLLIEEQRKNIKTYSQDLANPAAWTATYSTNLVSGFTSPDGTTNAVKATNTAGAVSLLQANIAIPASATNVYYPTIFVKKGNTSVVTLNVYYSVGAEFSVYFNLDTLTATGAPVANAYIIQNYGGGWFRIGYQMPAEATGTATLINYRIWESARTTGVAGNFQYYYGAQLELGAFPTSYIPTDSTAGGITRNADVATMTGANFSSWFNANEGTFSMAWNTPSVLIDCVPFTTNDNTDLNRIGCDTTATGFGRIIVSNAGNLEAFGGTSGIFVGKNTISVGYKNNNFGVANNGGTVTTDASGTVPTVDRLQIGRRLTSLYINGTVSKLNYWPQKLTTAEIQAFSK